MLKLFIRLVGLLSIVITLLAAGAAYEYRDFINTPLTLDTMPLHYEIKGGTSLKGIARDLHRRGILQHPYYLVWLAQWQGRAQQIKMGEYEIKPGTLPLELLDQLVAGRIVEYSLTVVEGWTFKQFRTAVQQHPALRQTLTGLSDAQLMQRLGWNGEHPEGRFYPDSYHFPKGATDSAFYQRAYQAMQEYLDKEWANRDPTLPLKTPYEALILASIVERETAVPGERPAIAGVFLRRLQAGMRLQTDPTVIYGLGSDFDGNLRRRDLERDHPYNTYTRTGLPPTPIALPGAASIHAVLHPASGKSLYFVARGDGSHAFSETLAEHNRAVQKYQMKPHKQEPRKP